MKRFVIPACAAALALFTLVGAQAQDKAKKKPGPLSPAQVAKFKVIKKKIDPEIKAAQNALKTAKSRLDKALNDEVFSEKGAVEGKVIDQLKLSIKGVETALKHANKAQNLDKGGD